MIKYTRLSSLLSRESQGTRQEGRVIRREGGREGGRDHLPPATISSLPREELNRTKDILYQQTFTMKTFTMKTFTHTGLIHFRSG